MKIMIIGPAYPYRGGLAAFNERLARQFAEEGHDVKVWTFTLQYPSFLFPGKTQYSTADAPENVKIYRKINSIDPLNWMKTGKELKKRHPDMVIFAYWMSFFVPCYGTIARFCANAGIRRMALVHNMIPHEPTLPDKLFPGCFVKNMDAFVALSSSVIGDIAQFDRRNKPKKMSPHPLYDHYGEVMPRQEAAKKLALDAEKQYVLFFGFIRKYKGLDLLLEAFADERLRKYPVELIVAGEFYESEQFYADLIARLPLAGLVELRTEFIPDDEVKYYFSAADIVAQPYRSATQSGVSQIACHFEKPVLVTNVGGLSEMIPDGKVGYVVAPSSVEIADALVDFFENKREKIFSENMREEKKKYAWSEMTNTFYELSKQLK